MKFSKKKRKTKVALKFIGSIIFFIVLIYFLDVWGWIGLVIFILGIVAMRFYKQRDFLKNIIRQIEMIIWHKPLDKDLWDKGEMKDTKVKIVWGKNKFDWDKYIMVLVYPALLLLFIGVMWNIYSVTIISVAFFSLIILVKLGYKIERSIQNVKSKEKNNG